MKLFPRNLSGQLVALWLVAMLAAHLIAVLVLSWWRADNVTIHPLSVRTIETRILSAYRVAGRADEPGEWLDEISLPDSTFALAVEPDAGEDGAATAMTGQEQALALRLRRLLDVPEGAPVYVRLRQTEPVPGATRTAAEDRGNWLEKAFRGTQATALDVDVRLPQGQWLHSRHWPTMLPAHWSRVLSFSLVVGMLPTVLIALLFGRRIMAPLRRLTEASKRVSRGEQVILPAADGLSGVREITKAFNDMQQSLVRFVNGRTQMIAAIGHDLRTPLTSLRIRAELIDDAELRDAMVQTIDDMGVMVEETLRFARDEALQEPTQDVQICHLVREVVDNQTIQGRSVSWTSQVDAGMFYRCRPVHLKRALGNVIDNAVRHGNVCVRILTDTVGRSLRIEIEDDGPGIEPGQLERVFEPFTRLDSARSMDSGGVGLGLAIARSCIRAHGGEISLQNRPEGGLRALIDLPN
ncbi:MULTISPECIES: ATP-binding protein [unclassified Cupriavidus]|uniref:ATP-binding protein n=1 Tax=unclassified Cupriavidus TaxID=2640874 RepID=UPI001BFFE1F4|nr:MULTISPECIES: ATP-binding protein [unclassified Cupriavidus]MCA3189027.1 HAMP domain-containing protein [Cupriavidus sp.]MCA3198746.1 HAMP domain-containing protein [Cupriavidus sp.]MCA3201492.1 HAMP domain-containing protein [Cupriavidus sp.]MCA3207661.1 HAMP domain-containing protein [Cupriavidus sp.]MCA3232701.1 HAMP domain-containing protein [Cupriavidus sp.]